MIRLVEENDKKYLNPNFLKELLSYISRNINKQKISEIEESGYRIVPFNNTHWNYSDFSNGAEPCFRIESISDKTSGLNIDAYYSENSFTLCSLDGDITVFAPSWENTLIVKHHDDQEFDTVPISKDVFSLNTINDLSESELNSLLKKISLAIAHLFKLYLNLHTPLLSKNRITNKKTSKRDLYAVFDNYDYDNLVEQEAMGWVDYMMETSGARVTNQMILDSFKDQGIEFVSESGIDPEVLSDDSYVVLSVKDICSDVKQMIRDLR